ncbi:MAG TPA: RodZ domain-containing protein [Sphingomicrobium sp.]|jgi:cytoskeletal protein RodZ
MAKRDTDADILDPDMTEAEVPTVGERLRAAREAKGLSLEDVAAQTRIPHRHLESIENAQWDKLPAPTYTIGFAKSYASAVGVDRTEIGDQLREEMGGQRFASHQAEVIEPADPARTMPKWLVISAIVGVILLVLLMSWLSRRSLEQGDAPASTAVASSPAPAAQTPSPAAQQPAAQGPVVLTAVQPAWIQVTDQGKSLFQGELQQGQSFTVPQTATAPLLKAGKPEALKVTVGTATAPAVGPAGKVASKVSLKADDLMRGGAQPATGAAQPPAPPPAQ